MPVFEIKDLVTESLALWLVLSGLAWVLWSGARLVRGGVDTTVVLLAAAGVLSWAAVLRLTTAMLGGQEIIPLGLVPLVWSGIPVYAVLAVLCLIMGAGVALSSRSTAALLALLLLSVVGPSVALPLLVGDAEEVRLFSAPPPQTVAEPVPSRPIVHDSRPDMVFVPAGPFILGTLNPAQLRPIVGTPLGDEQPVRTIQLSAFYIDRHEVTNADFARFVAAAGHVTEAESKGYGQVWGPQGWFRQEGADWQHPMGPSDSIVGLQDHPVVQVSWNDATAFCAWEDKRLPSEVEWEKAARGVDARDYPWGTTFDPGRLNYCDAECGDLLSFSDSTVSDGYVRTAPVGTFPDGASPYGAFDMVGNVWEWTADWYDAEYYTYAAAVDPPGPTRSAGIGADEHRVVRGGSWTSERDFARATSRSYDPPSWSYFGVGFRCAADG